MFQFSNSLHWSGLAEMSSHGHIILSYHHQGHSQRAKYCKYYKSYNINYHEIGEVTTFLLFPFPPRESYDKH